MDNQFCNKTNKKETVILKIYQKHEKRLKALQLIKNAEFASVSSMSFDVSKKYPEKVLFWRSHVSAFSGDCSNGEDFLKGKLTTHRFNLSAPSPKALWSTDIIFPCIFHTFQTQWSTIRPFSLFSTRHFSKKSAIFVSNHRASSFRSSTHTNLSLAVLFLLFVALVSIPKHATLGYLQSTSAAVPTHKSKFDFHSQFAKFIYNESNLTITILKRLWQFGKFYLTIR